MLVHGRRTVELIVVRLPGAVTFTHLRVFFREVEGVGQLAAGEHVERSGGEPIERLHLAGIHFSLESIDAGEQLSPVLKLREGEVAEHHVAPPFAVGLERRVSRAEKTGLAGVGPADFFRWLRETDKWWYRWLRWALQFGDNRTEARPASKRGKVGHLPAGHALKGIVPIGGADDRANDRAAVHDSGKLR